MYTRQCVLYRDPAGLFKICEPAETKTYLRGLVLQYLETLAQQGQRSTYDVYCANVSVIRGSGVEIPYVMNLPRIPKPLNPYFKILIFC